MANLMIDYYASEYAILKAVYKLSDKLAAEGAELYEQAGFERMRDADNHRYVFVQIIDGLNWEQAYEYLKVFNDKINEIGDEDLTYKYAVLKVLNKFSDEQAKKGLEIYRQLLGKGKSDYYAIKYAALKVFNELNDRKIDKISKAYEQKMNECRNANYADRFVMLKVINNFNDRQSEMAAKVYLDYESKSKEFADEYIRLSLLRESKKIEKLNEEKVREYAQMFYKELQSGKSKIYAHGYVLLRIENYNEAKARLIAEALEKEMKSEEKHAGPMVIDDMSELEARLLEPEKYNILSEATKRQHNSPDVNDEPEFKKKR